MTFSEMKSEYDKFGAFSDYVTISHAKKVGIIPQDYIAYFPDYCECGSERIISFNLRTMQCSDPRCPIKQSLALANMFANFSCKGVGEALCKQAFSEVTNTNNKKINNGEEPLFKSKSYVEILTFDETAYSASFNTSEAGYTFLTYCKYIRSKQLTFPEMISKLGLPELETTAIKLFDGINTFNELKSEVSRCSSINNFCESRGFHDPMKKFWLFVSLEDIYVASIIFAHSIRQVGLIDEQVCITGSIFPRGNRMTKATFIDYCNKNAYSAPIIDLIKSAFQEAQIQNVPRELCERLSTKLGIALQNNTYATLTEFFNDLDKHNEFSQGIQLFEIRLSTAKMSARHIIADQESNSDKYKTGLMRGTEYDQNGNEIKVLITSDQYLEELERRKDEWNQNYKNEILTLILDSVPLKTMNLV